MSSTHQTDLILAELLPHPVAVMWRKLHRQNSTQARINHLKECLEVALKTSVSFLIPDYLSGSRDERVDALLLEKLERPTPGKLVEVVRHLLSHLRDRESPETFFDQAVEWYYEERGRPTFAARSLDELVELRNHQEHKKEKYTSRGPEEFSRFFEGKIRSFLLAAEWLQGYRAFFILGESMKLQRDKKSYRGSIEFLVGSNPVTNPTFITGTPDLYGESVYLAHPDGVRLLDVSPFVTCRSNRAETPQCYILDSVPKGKDLKLVCPDTGETLPEVGIPVGDLTLPLDAFLEREVDTSISLEVSNPQYGSVFEKSLPWKSGTEGVDLGERFECKEFLGEGGMAHVYKVFDTIRKDERALKVLKPELVSDHITSERFKREYQLMSGLKRPENAKGKGKMWSGNDSNESFGSPDWVVLGNGSPAISMRFFSGGSVQERIKSGQVSDDDIIRWTKKALMSLRFYHEQNIVHRDVKPSNLLLDELDNLHLVDFGVARDSKEPHVTRTEDVVGTYAYMAPEQRMTADVTPKADIYSLALVIRNLVSLTLDTPSVPGEDLTLDIPSVPEEELSHTLKPLVEKMGRADPEERLSAAQALEEFSEITRGPQDTGEGEDLDFAALLPVLRPFTTSIASFTTSTRIAFDIEIANVFELEAGEDLDDYGPFDISCAAAANDNGDVIHWTSTMQDGSYANHLDAAKAKKLLAYLRMMQLLGNRLFAWNGLSFDLRWIGVAAEDVDLAAEVALDLYDPMFQFFVQRGFPVGLAKVAEGLGVTETKLMDGADAPVQWAQGNHQLVLDYVAGDCRITDAVVARIEETGGVTWRTSRGTLSTEPMPKLKQIRELLDAPELDTSWMDAPLPRSKFTSWLP
jgi:serine/threonine protein kinase